jgi:hypothetical protein
MIGGIFILPLLELQKTLSIKISVQTIPYNYCYKPFSFQVWLKGNITLQKLKRVYCICFWECTYTKKWFSLVYILENCDLNMQYKIPEILY